MPHLSVKGGKKLHGVVPTQANKNSAISILCACLMIKGRVVLLDVPQIEDVERLLELITSLGVSVQKQGQGRIVIDASGVLAFGQLNRSAAEQTRASLLLWGALAGRVRGYSLAKAGGCHLGQRTVRPHWYALQKFGIKIVSRAADYAVSNPATLRAANVIMYESGDTTTENVIMAAVLAKGATTIKMASANYMVQDLCHFLVSAGADIRGIGTTTLAINGVKELKPPPPYPIMPDPIVAMTLLSAAITTGSRLTVSNCPLEFLELELCKLEVMGQKYAIHNRRQSKNGQFVVADIEVAPSRLTALPDKIYGRPFPGLNIDNLPLFIPILTQAKGRTLVHDWAYENRAVYSLELQKLGADITLLDPHRLWVEGSSQLTANEIVCPPALRPAVNVLICMLAAKGTSILRNTSVIDRGYENLYEILNTAGASITVVND